MNENDDLSVLIVNLETTENTTGEDVKYIRIGLCCAAEREQLLDSNGRVIIGYFDGEDEPLLFPHVDNKHPVTKHYFDNLVIDVKTGQIVNWKPYTDEELNDVLDEFYRLQAEQDFWEAGGTQ